VQGRDPKKAGREKLCSTCISGGLQLQNGWILYKRCEGRRWRWKATNLRLALDSSGSAGQPMYLGTIDWQSIRFTAKAVPSMAGEHFREIHDARGWLSRWNRES